MFIRLHMRVLCFAIAVLVFAAPWASAGAQQEPPTPADLGVSADTQADLSDASTAIWLTRLNDIELLLRDSEIDPEVRSRAIRDLNAISEGAKARIKDERERLRPINRELESLGPAPAEGEAAESEEVASLRQEVAERIADIDLRLREIQLVLVRAENLELSLIRRAEGPLLDRLLERSTILWEAETWGTAANQWIRMLSAVAAAPGAWWNSSTVLDHPTKLLLSIGASLIALFLSMPARRWLRLHLGRREDELDPTYARRIFAALVTAVADVLLPSLALGSLAIAITFLSESNTLVPVLAVAACVGGMFYFLLTGLSRAVLAPQEPTWRILPVTDEGAVVLNRRIHVLAIYVVVLEVIFRTAGHLGLLESPEFETVSTLFFDGALAALLLTLLPSQYWHSEEEEGPSRKVVGISITLGALLIAVPVLDLVGFSALASYFLLVLVATVVAAGSTLLLRVACQEALVQLLRPAGALRLHLYRWMRLGDGGARVLRIVVALLIDSFFFMALAYGLLRFYGLPNALLLHWLGKFAEGLPIGNVVLSPIDIVVAILVFVGVLLATGMLRRWLSEKLRTGTRMDVGIRNAIVSGVGYGGVVIAIVVAIAIVGLDLSNLALVAGALSVGVGFGLRTVVENFVAGLLLLVERPIKEGDWIVTAGYQGTVKRISVRSTEIETFDRASVIVPNAELVAQPVQNWTHKNRMARIIVPVGVAYGSDTAKVREILLACAADHQQVLRYPEPTVLFQQFGDSSLNFELRCFVRDTDYVLECMSDLNFAVDQAFRDEAIEIPFPQRDLHLRDGLPLRVETAAAPPAEERPSASPPAPPPAPTEEAAEVPPDSGPPGGEPHDSEGKDGKGAG